MEDWDANLSPCNFATAHFPAERSSLINLQLRDHPFDSLHSEFLSPLNFATHETEDPFATPQIIFEKLRISRAILLKCLSFLDISRAQNTSKITKKQFSGNYFRNNSVSDGNARGDVSESQLHHSHVSHLRVKKLQFRDAEATILKNFAFWRGGWGGEKFMENCPKTSFLLGNSMTIKFGIFANVIVRNFVVIWEAPNCT